MKMNVHRWPAQAILKDLADPKRKGFLVLFSFYLAGKP